MKKYITVAALLAAGTAFANAAITLSTIVPEGGTENGGNFYGVAFSLNSDWLDDTLSPTEYSGFSLDSITLKGRADGTDSNGDPITYAWTSGIKLCITSSSGVAALSDGLTTIDGKNAKFTFSDSSKLDLNTTYLARIVSSSTHWNETKTTVTGGNFNVQQQLAGYSSGDLGTSDATTGFITTNTGTIGNHDYKGVISITGTPIPEPSAFGLLAGAGALALVAARRRRAK